MSSARLETFTLLPHPAARSDAVHDIGGRISRLADGTLTVTYIVEGDIDRVRVPPQATGIVDGLWRHTCCELFIARKGATAYHEFNFSPSGEWAVYTFARTRERLAFDAVFDAATLDPQIAVRRSVNKLELDATVRLDRLVPGYTRDALTLALSAVIEDRDGTLSYWALKHPLDKPDFHHPDSFVLELDEIRN